jgi:protein-L-isoaspartate(D-aspartate) O-methyltransferase
MNKQMVSRLIEMGVLKSPEIIEAFLHVDRAFFLPESGKDNAYINEPLSIGFGQTISQPWTVAFMLEKLAPQKGDKILDIGAGSGWQSALLSYIVSHDSLGNLLSTDELGHVIGIEIIPELARIAIGNLSKFNYLKSGILELHCLDGINGYPKGAPFDKIIAAAAGDKIPHAWKEQLSSGGVIVAPVDSTITKIIKEDDKTFKSETFSGFSFVPLV